MSGESTKNSDFRKAVKVKPPKKKDPLKGKIPLEAKASKKKKKTKENTEAAKATADKENMTSGGAGTKQHKTMNTTQKGKCFALRRGVSRKSGYTTYSLKDKVGLSDVHT